ncbi:MULTISPECIES: hypothetical protein [Citrobacter freundii complex]
MVYSAALRSDIALFH